jgi:hypothetical protein
MANERELDEELKYKLDNKLISKKDYLKKFYRGPIKDEELDEYRKPQNDRYSELRKLLREE